MAITYPLALPAHTGIRSVSFRARNAVAYSMSPFTFAGQAHQYAGQMWEADITLPPMRRTAAEQWNAFLLSLNGQAGTFLLGDPNGCVPRGTASAAPGTPIITDQTGSTISVTGAAVSQTGWLLAGDYIQLGAAATATLHKVLVDVDTDVSGNATLDVWPAVRGTRSSSVVVANAVGRFRLAENVTGWNADVAQYGISFSAMEAV